MNRVEAIPLESMRKGMRWDWETFPEFMDSLDSHGLGVNVAPSSPFPQAGLRAGDATGARETSVTEGELAQMKQLFHEAMKAGAFGISADKNMEDRPEDGASCQAMWLQMKSFSHWPMYSVSSGSVISVGQLE